MTACDRRLRARGLESTDFGFYSLGVWLFRWEKKIPVYSLSLPLKNKTKKTLEGNLRKTREHYRYYFNKYGKMLLAVSITIYIPEPWFSALALKMYRIGHVLISSVRNVGHC